MHDYEIYCDESHPELFVAGPNSTITTHAAIGSVWLPASRREDIKSQVRVLRQHHGIWGEAKWTKVGSKSLAFYKDLVDVLLTDSDIRFRSIIVEAQKLDLTRFHQDDPELGFYKFYYQVIHHWTTSEETARVFCDSKVNRDLTRLTTLRDVLNRKFQRPCIESIHAVASDQSSLIQLCDVLLGAVQAKFNKSNRGSKPKLELIRHVESRIGHPIGATVKAEKQFNVFKIQLSESWTGR